ncbi:MAG: hypothetical protein HXY44_04800 [Syntrophaceae bacterium]|nr:hypothetical protein [Syntrophaceae bacterium]
MESTLVNDAGGMGKWIVILGGPLIKKNSIIDNDKKISGPTFSDCASFKFQDGKDFQLFDASGEFPVAAFLKLIQCGYPHQEK